MRWLLITIVVTGAAIAAILAGGGREGTLGASDALLDWIVVDAIRAEGSPHDRLDELFRQRGYTAPTETHSHPRTPAALLLQMPLLLVDKYDARLVMSAVSVTSLVAVTAVAWRLTRLPEWLVAGIATAFAFSLVMRQAFTFGTQSMLVAALIGFAWWLVENNRTRAAGLLLGVAVSLKLFPGLLVAVLVVTDRGRRVAAWSIGTFLILNVVGLALPDVSLAGTLEAFRSAHEWNEMNALNLGVPPIATVLGSLAFVVLGRRLDLSSQLMAGSVAMIVLSPTAWIHYGAMLLLPLLMMLDRFLAPAGLSSCLCKWSVNLPE